MGDAPASLASQLEALILAAGREIATGPEPGVFLILPDEDDLTSWDLIAVADEAVDGIVIYAVCPFDAKPARRAALAEAISEANFGMVDGAFELDPADGQLRFRIGLLLGGTDLDPELVSPMLAYAATAVDEYAEPLLAVLRG